MANNTLRMSGLNSGLDTEAIVNALTAATKNKINKNQRSILQLQAQQEAYRDIINKFNAFKDKYFDILNVGTCLKSKTMFNSFKSTLTSSTGTNYVPGVTVSSSTNANAATYDVYVEKVATQATRKSSSDIGKALDLDSAFENGQMEAGRDYTMKITVGSTSKYITFTAGDNAEQTRDNINEELKKSFGVSNSGSGLVELGEDGKFTSADKSAVVYTSPTLYANERVTHIDPKTGNNSFTITVNGQTKTVTFSTVSEDYFNDIFNDDGSLKTEDQIKSELSGSDQTEALKKLSLYKDVVNNQRDGEVWNAYENWWNDLDEDAKKAFAEQVASSKYQSAMDDIDKSFEEASDAALKQYLHSKAMGDLKPGDEGYVSFNDYFNGNEEEGIEAHVITDEEREEFKNTDEYLKLVDDTVKTKEKVEELYNGYVEKVVEKEVNAAYNEQFELAKAAAKQAAWEEAMDGKEEGVDEDYVSLEDFKFSYTKADFEAEVDGEHNQYYEAYLTKRDEIEAYYADEDHKYTIDLDGMKDTQRAALYDEFVPADQKGVKDEDDYIAEFTENHGGGTAAAKEAAYLFNKSNIENNLKDLYFANTVGGVELDVVYERDGTLTITAKNPAGIYTPQFAITANAGSTNDFGFDVTDVSGTASQVSTTSTLDELDLQPDANGNYTFSINGVSFSFTGDTTISDMMKKINASTAGVKMSYTSLTNQFIITANEYGTGVDINFTDNSGVLGALGFTGSDEEFTAGTNSRLEINGVWVETTSNSYTVDGTTFTFTKAAEGQSFTNEVTRDYSKAIDTIKSFVEDYNKLIDDIYGYVDDEPNKDYYFLTDDDIDEMGLSETQQNKWEKMAKKGLLYRDSTLTDIMSSLRTVLYNSVDAADGSKVGLYTLGITTSSDYSNHGKLVFDDTKDFEALFEQYADEITELFTNSENGIATQFEKIIDNATRTTGGPGERGSLVDKAGVSGTASATSNTIYNKIKSLQDLVLSLQRRYDQQQDRFWKIYGNMETMLGNLNSQTSYINQLLGNY